MKTTRLFISLFLLLMVCLLTFTPYGRAAAQTGTGTGDPVTQPASLTDGPETAPAPSSPNAPADIVPALSGCARVNVPAVNDAYEQRVVELTNIERANNGLPPLKRNVDLDYAARFHAKDMAEEHYFEHDSYDGDGGSVLVCNWANRVKNFFTGDGYLGENIAAGYSTPESVVDGWINSPGHHANMLNSNFREIGVGYYNGGSYGHYWVQDFSRRSGYYPLIINNEAYSTSSLQVTIYLYGAGDWSEMRLSNDGTNWTSWRAFQSTFSWTLPCPSGTKTVYAQMRARGHVNVDATASDSIILQPTASATFGQLPDNAVFIYDQSTKQLIMPSRSYKPANTTSCTTLNWTATKSGFAQDWLTLSTSSGSTSGGVMTLSASNVNSIFNTVGDYSGTLTLKATAADGGPVNNATVPINMHLVVVPKAADLYLPSMNLY